MIAALNAAEAGANLARNWADVVAGNLASAGLPRAKNSTVDLVAAEDGRKLIREKYALIQDVIDGATTPDEIKTALEANKP